MYNFLAKGGFGTLYEKKDSVFKVSGSFQDNDMFFPSAIVELNVLRTMRHPHIAKYIGFRLDDYSCQIEMKKYKESLAKFLLRRKVTEEQAIPMFWQIFTAVEFLHSYGFLHLDLKSANVLLDTEQNCYLCDFGCGVYNFNSPLYDNGTEICRSPENFMPFFTKEEKLIAIEKTKCQNIRYSEKTDSFGLGTLLLDMITLKYLFFPTNDLSNMKPKTLIIEYLNDPEKYLLNYISKWSTVKSKDLILGLLKPNHDERFSDSQIRASIKEFSDVQPTGYRERHDYSILKKPEGMNKVLEYFKDNNTEIDVSFLTYDIVYRYLSLSKEEKEDLLLIESALYLSLIFLGDPDAFTFDFPISERISKCVQIIRTLDALVLSNNPFMYSQDINELLKDYQYIRSDLRPKVSGRWSSLRICLSK